MRHFLIRSVTSLVYAVILIAGMVIHKLLFAIVFLALMILALIEYYRLAELAGAKPQKITGIVTAVLFFGSLFGYGCGFLPVFSLLSAVLFLFLTFVFELYRKKSQPIANIAFTHLGFLYIVFPIGLTNFLVFPGLPDDKRFYPWLLFGITITIWIFDSVAYMVGTAVGKHRLFERISPKKSWEGSIAGGVMALLTGVLNASLFPSVEISGWLTISFIVVITGSFGDLVESLFKRSLNLKDSGNLLPEHGGILDRLDSFLFVVPFVVTWLFVFGLK